MAMPSPSPKYALDPALVALGDAIRRARLASGMSQEDLAFQSKIERSYMSSVERGMQNVGVMALVRVAGTLKITVAELLASAGI